MNEGNAKQQIVEGIKTNSNVLVTVSDSPSVDELSAALGLTLLLNKLDKRATAIFSGQIPPAITFLDPEKTFEGTVDSLRDFIIALDKEKADHLRYKVDGDVVKIFITPYRTTLSEKDLEFSQGDYNVELVIALGVSDQEHLDKALSAHGKILHDALVTTISIGETASELGNVDWLDAAASSYCEVLVSLAEALKDEGGATLLDQQIATAFLTGIVAATERFSNARTTSRVMTMAAQLMAAGADQQLIAAQLQEKHEATSDIKEDETAAPADEPPVDTPSPETDAQSSDSTALTLKHDAKKSAKKSKAKSTNKPSDDKDKTAVVTSPAEKPVEAVTVADATVEPPKDVEAELAAKLGELPDAAPAAPSPEELQKELSEVLAPTEDTSQATAPVNVSDAITAPVDDSMPGFEALDVPTPAPVVDTPIPAPVQIERSSMIDANDGRQYVSGTTTTPFDAQVEGVIGGSNTTANVIDPFSAPLPPMPQLPDVPPLNTDMTPLEPEPESSKTAPTEEEAQALQQLEGTTPLSADVPPLPPLPDFSTLPDAGAPTDSSLPPPPPPPIFGDQANTSSESAAPLPTQSGAISSDQLGDIFNDLKETAENPTVAATESTPPSPGQFRIPGQ